jgi:hypothetical protein
MYSYVTTSTAAGFRGEVMGLKSPWSCLEAATELKDRAEAKLYMYCLGGAACALTPSLAVLITRRG